MSGQGPAMQHSGHTSLSHIVLTPLHQVSLNCPAIGSLSPVDCVALFLGDQQKAGPGRGKGSWEILATAGAVGEATPGPGTQGQVNP